MKQIGLFNREKYSGQIEYTNFNTKKYNSKKKDFNYIPYFDNENCMIKNKIMKNNTQTTHNKIMYWAAKL